MVLNNANPRCFVTQYVTNLNYEEAAKWGEVIFCTAKEFRPEPAPKEINKSIQNEIVTRMKDYIPGIDFIITTGSAIPNVIVGGVISGYAINGVLVGHKILKWNNRKNSYELFILQG